MAYKRNSIEVPELEILLAGKKKKYVRYEEGAILYSLGIRRFTLFNACVFLFLA